MPKIVLFLLLGALIVLSTLATWLFTAKPWRLPVQMSEPGPSGVRVTTDSLIGNYYPVERKHSGPAILIFGGSEGGLSESVAQHARALQSAGYSTFHFSWWRAPGQAQRIENIPIESFEAALGWLQSQPGVDPNRIAVFGWSRGTEPAQLLAVRHPEIRALVLGMPTNAIWPGFDWDFLGPQPPYAWTLSGRPVATIPRAAIAGVPMRAWTGKQFQAYVRALGAHQDALIPIERIKAQVLLICGEADRIWPSGRMARSLRDRALAFGKMDVTLLCYEGAGHMAYGAPAMPNDRNFVRQARIGGGEISKNAAALADSFKTSLAFLRAALGDIDLEQKTRHPLDNPFGPRVSPM